MKMACSGVMRSVTTTPDAVYCAAAIAEKIHVWEVWSTPRAVSPLLTLCLCAGVHRAATSSGGPALPASVSAGIH